MILIDPPAWPAHGTLWSHLVSDSSLDELHAFAAVLGAPRRGFDLDHYDLPADRYQDALSAGAAPVGGGELVRRLIGSGLRVPGRDRAPLKQLRRRWLALRPDDYPTGDDLLRRWREPHRRYHGPQHLAECLDALDVLVATDDASGRPGEHDLLTAGLALWFHDAVHDGATPGDEEASAALVLQMLDGPAVLDRAPEPLRVADLVRMTARHDPVPGDRVGALVSDADLAILAAGPERYDDYARQVRAEYAHVPEPEFRAGRRAVLDGLLGGGTLYRTDHARLHWTPRAEANLRRELAALARRPT